MKNFPQIILFLLMIGVFLISQQNQLISAADAGAVYAAKCAKCHGADGKGVEKYKKSGQKDFTDAAFQKSRTDAQLTESINNGKGDFMPAWRGKLSAEEIKGLVGQIRAFGRKNKTGFTGFGQDLQDQMEKGKRSERLNF